MRKINATAMVRWMKANKLTASDVAGLVGVSESAVGNWTSRRTGVSRENYVKLKELGAFEVIEDRMPKPRAVAAKPNGVAVNVNVETLLKVGGHEVLVTGKDYRVFVDGAAI